MDNICDVYKETNDIKGSYLIYLEAMANFDSSKTFNEEFHIVMQPHRHIVKINSP